MKKLLALPALLLVLGCSNPADDVPAASVGPASTPSADVVETSDAANESTDSSTASDSAAAAPQSDDPSAAYQFGPENSKIEFIGSKVTGSHEGGFNKFFGMLRVAEGKLADQGIEVEIDTNSLWSDNERLTGHLKNQDFFHVEEYPTATLVSTKVEPSDSGVMITGDLTLHGVSKSISFPAQVEISGETVRLTSEFSINRFDFDIKYEGKADDLIRKEVVIKLEVTASRGSAE
jgi:polyisoprenoid-binding protein YceI